MANQSSSAPDSSSGVAGTQLGSIKNTSIGRRSVASSIYSMPSVPMTLVISCGSVTIAVVPCGTTARANSRGTERDDSMWMCASRNPGQTILPETSSSFSPSYFPMPAILPQAIAMSPVQSSCVNTLT